MMKSQQGCGDTQPQTRDRRWHVALFEQLQRSQSMRVRIEAVSLDVTIVKVHPNGTGALKKAGPNPSASREVDGPPKFIWLLRMLERPWSLTYARFAAIADESDDEMLGEKRSWRIVHESRQAAILWHRVAVYPKTAKKTVYRLAQQGETPAFKLGGTWRFRRSELDRWIATQIAEKTQDKT